MSKSVLNTSKTQCITLRINEEKVKSIEKLATKNNMSKNKFIIKCVEFAINHMVPETQKGDFSC